MNNFFGTIFLSCQIKFLEVLLINRRVDCISSLLYIFYTLKFDPKLQWGSLKVLAPRMAAKHCLGQRSAKAEL